LRKREEGNEAHAIAFAKELAFKVRFSTSHLVHAALVEPALVQTPWEELDMEEKNLREDSYSGLGFSKAYPDWYGGKVHFRARIVDQGSAGFKVELDPAELGPSCRFARRFGSTALLRVKIPLGVFNKAENRLINFFSRPFVLNGRVFRSFFAKDDNVFMFRTNEIFRCSAISAGVKEFGLSLLEFLNWHNPLCYNQHQACVLSLLLRGNGFMREYDLRL
jgi:RNA-dependent RNA polymerase